MRPHRASLAVALSLLLVLAPVVGGVADTTDQPAVTGLPTDDESADAPSVDIRAQTIEINIFSDRIRVASATLPDGGFLAVYGADGGLLDVTAFRQPGAHTDVPFERNLLDRTQNVTVVAYRDTDGDETADVAETLSDLTTDDEPYLVDGEPVTDRATVTLSANTRIEMDSYRSDTFVEGSIVTISAQVTSEIIEEPLPVTQVAGPTATRISDEAPRVIGDGGGGGQFIAPAVDEPTTLVFRANYTDQFGNEFTETIDVVVEPAPANPTADVSFADQESDGRNVTVERFSSTEGGFVAIYNESPDTAGPENVIGVTNYIRPGEYDGLIRPDQPDGFVRTGVPLFDVPGRTFERENITGTQTLYAVFHRDTDDDQTFDFVTSDGETDGPYVGDDGPVSMSARVSVKTVYWQVDLIGGEPYQRLGPHADNGFYADADEDRLLRFAHGTDREGLTTQDTAWPTEDLRTCVDSTLVQVVDDGTAASVTFTVAEGCADVELTLAVYEKDGEGFSRQLNQTLFDSGSGTFGPGTDTLVVDLPGDEETD